ncbi:MAG: hypothetical protein O2890_11450 [Cyanobacteria bacterium]|nr:hypothetical protein [Cyanobacteriota bacterium]MDA0867010.1 hypothetical protein [Cyanobacteriota bacterium]
MLKFSNPKARQQAEQLMQPALIRVIDNIRKCLDDSPWAGRYQEAHIWPERATEADIQQVKALITQLEHAQPEQVARLEAQLAELPQPFPVYELHLTQGDQKKTVDLWDLCYRTCFKRFPVGDQAVAVDMTLWDQEMGDVNWVALDEKAKALVQQVFSELETQS